MITRRGAILGALFAPAVIRTPGLLMPVKPTAFEHDWKFKKVCAPVVFGVYPTWPSVRWSVRWVEVATTPGKTAQVERSDILAEFLS